MNTLRFACSVVYQYTYEVKLATCSSSPPSSESLQAAIGRLTSVPVLISLFWFLDRAQCAVRGLGIFTVSDVPLRFNDDSNHLISLPTTGFTATARLRAPFP